MFYKGSKSKAKIHLLLLILAGLIFTSCISTKEYPDGLKACLTKCQSRFFWRIDGTDKRGKPSTVYIQGTYHIGDQRLYPVAEEVMTAFRNSDRLVAEVSSAESKNLEKEISLLYVKSYNPENNILEALSPEAAKNLAYLYEGEENVPLHWEPWIYNSSINASLNAASGLKTELGLDHYFKQEAAKMKKEVLGLDSLETQLRLSRYGDYESQLIFLEDTMTDFPFTKNVEDLIKVYEYYLSGREEELDRLVFGDEEEYLPETRLMDAGTGSDINTSSETYLDERTQLYTNYYREVFIDRNFSWAQQIAAFLYQGKSTFIFAGAGHFIGSDSVFQLMKEAGDLE